MGTTLKTDIMKFETEFNVGQTVFVVHNDVIQKALVTQIVFPKPSLILDCYKDNDINIYVWPRSQGKLPESRSYACQISICKRVSEVGNSIDDLLSKLKENAKSNGLTK